MAKRVLPVTDKWIDSVSTVCSEFSEVCHQNYDELDPAYHVWIKNV